MPSVPPPLVVGVFAESLRPSNPRGVASVARPIAELLIGYADLELVALSRPRYHRHGIVFQAVSLQKWLSRRAIIAPNDIRSTLRSRRFRMQWFGRTIAARIGNCGRLAARPLAGLAKLLGIYDPLRSLYRRWRGISDAAAPRRAKRHISMRDVNVILSFDPFEPIWDWPCELYKTRMLAFYCDTGPFRIDGGNLRIAERHFRATGRIALRAHGICCSSESVRRDVETLFPETARFVSVAPPGHDVERFGQAAAISRSWLHERFGCRGKILVVHRGGDAGKNLAGVFQACRHLGGSKPHQLTLLVISQLQHSDPDEHLRRAASQYVQVVEAGEVTDGELAKILAASDLFVCSSLWDGCGVPILQAMSAGTPVVCSDLSSFPELGGEHADYCDPYDPQSIATAIRTVLDRPEAERNQRLAAAKEWASQFTWRRTAMKIHEHILRVVREGPAAADADKRAPLRRPA